MDRAPPPPPGGAQPPRPPPGGKGSSMWNYKEPKDKENKPCLISVKTWNEEKRVVLGIWCEKVKKFDYAGILSDQKWKWYAWMRMPEPAEDVMSMLSEDQQKNDTQG